MLISFHIPTTNCDCDTEYFSGQAELSIGATHILRVHYFCHRRGFMTLSLPLSIKYNVSPQLIPLTFFFLHIHCHFPTNTLIVAQHNHNIPLATHTKRSTLPPSLLHLHFHLAYTILLLFHAHHTVLLARALRY